MNEDKQKICKLLCAALKATKDQRNLKDILYVKYTEYEELATLYYENGHKKDINVTDDSGIQTIKDILACI